MASGTMLASAPVSSTMVTVSCPPSSYEERLVLTVRVVHATISTYLHDNAAINDLIAKLKAGVQVGDTEFKLADNADEDALKAQCMVLTQADSHRRL